MLKLVLDHSWNVDHAVSTVQRQILSLLWSWLSVSLAILRQLCVIGAASVTKTKHTQSGCPARYLLPLFTLGHTASCIRNNFDPNEFKKLLGAPEHQYTANFDVIWHHTLSRLEEAMSFIALFRRYGAFVNQGIRIMYLEAWV